jgi:hypothetical protein
MRGWPADRFEALMANTARGWRRIGIVLSMIWFLGFGVFLWNAELHVLFDPYVYQLEQCGHLADSSTSNRRRGSETMTASTAQQVTSQHVVSPHADADV